MYFCNFTFIYREQWWKYVYCTCRREPLIDKAEKFYQTIVNQHLFPEYLQIIKKKVGEYHDKFPQDQLARESGKYDFMIRDYAPGNERARHSYEKVGFYDTGEMENGENIMRFDF